MADPRSAKDARGNPGGAVRVGGEAEVSPEEEELLQPAPLPEWPLNWTSLGIRIETLLPVDPKTLVNTMNVVGRPAFSMAIVDVHVLVAEELAIDPPTELGQKLKAAQKTGEAEWLTPELVNMVLEAKSLVDRDEECRIEEQRRIANAETCKLNIKEAKAKETEAKQHFEEGMCQMREFDQREKERKERESSSSFIATAAATAAAALGGGIGSKLGSKAGSKKASAKAPPVKSSKAGSRVAPASTQVLSPEEERKQLEHSIATLQAALLACEKKVKMVEHLDRKQEAEKSNPLTTTRIYWCLGLGETAEELIKHVTVPHMFKAVFKLEKKLPLENVQLFKPSPVPPFIKELLALAQANKLDHPARKIPVLDVLYEDPPPPKLVELGGESGKPAVLSSPLGEPPRGDLPYDMLAKAIVSGIVCLQQQMEAFTKLDGSITGNFEIPEAVPRKDVNVTYYKALLDTVPAEWVSIPILLHCMVEQVAYYDTSLEDMTALEAANANDRLATGFDASILRLGQGLSCMRRSSALLHDIVEEIRAKQAEQDLHTVEEMLKVFLEIAGDEAERRNEEAEKLAADAAAKAAEGEVAATVDAIAVGKEPPEKRKSDRNSSVLKLVQGSEGDKKSMKDGPKSSKDDGRNSSKDDWERTSKETSSRTGPTLKQRLSKSGSKRDSHISWDPAASEVKELVGASAEKGDEYSLVMHEFSRVGRLERTVKHKALEFLDSVDVVDVEKHMLSLLGYPGKDRASMPKIPFLSDEKRGACLEALRWFVRAQSELPPKDLYSNYKQEQREQTYGRPRLMETLERPEGPRSKMGPLNLAAIQRYKKLRMLLEILSEEEKRAFNLPDDSGRAPCKGPEALAPKEEQADDGRTEEERKELDKGNDILHYCGCQSLRPLNSGRVVSNAPAKEDSTLSSPSKLREPFLPFQRITDRRFIEALPTGLLGEVYGRARTRLPYRVYRYDRDEDCMIEALYADDRDHVWQGVAASQIGFGDYVAKMGNPSPAMLVTGKHATYDVEEKYAIVLERYKCHLAEHQGLVWTGLPAKTDIQWEPQTTVIKDGHIILLRALGPDDSSDSPRVKSVNACLRDGLVVSFFIDNDGTMSMQVTNPANQTFEITSTGIVRMFASHLHASQVVETAETPEGEVPGRRGDGKTAEQPPLPSPPPPPPPEEGAEGAKSEEPVEKRTLRDFLLQEKGEQESWRCILPTGTVVRYRNNGDAQVLYRQGNVSDFRHDHEGGPCWITANNEGFLVVQRDPPEGEADEKLAEEELPPRGAPPPPPPPPPEKKVFIKKGSKAGSQVLEVPSEVPEVKPIEPTEPIFIPLPNLKVVHFYDPETGDEVMTREDLVVVISSERKKSTFVQHADGTHIYSVITEVCSTPENVMSQGEAMMDQIAEVFPKNPPRIKPEVFRPEGEMASKDESGEGNKYGERRISAAAEGTEKKGSVRHTLAEKKDILMSEKNPSISESEGSEKQYIKPSLLDLHPPPVLPEISTTWHIHKEGLAKVQGKFGSETQQAGVCVEFETVDGLYAATWSKKARQISLSMPGGATLYSVGSTVSFDPTDGSKKHDPYQTEEDDRKHGPFVNTNGLYVFDVVEGSLTFTDNAGQGFRVFGRGTEWETITSGKTATQNAKEAPIIEQILLAHATAIPQGLEQDLFTKYFPNDPPSQNPDLEKSRKKGNPDVPAESPPKPEKKGSIKKSVKGSKLGSVLGAEIAGEAGSTSACVDVRADFELTPLGEWKPPHPISRPATATPPSSEPPEPIMLGPYPRLFVIHEAGHGYEFLHEEMYQLYEIAKFYNKMCSKNSEKYVISDEEAVFHTFVTTENRKQIGLNKLIKDEDNDEDEEHDFTPSLTLPASRRVSLHAMHVQGKHRSNKLQTRTKCDWIQLQYSLPKLPRVINPSTPDIDSNQDTPSFVYRQIVELPSIPEAIQKKMDKILEDYSRWQWVNLGLQEIEIISDTRTDEDILMERYIACRIRESKKFKRRETLRASRLSLRG